MTATLRFGMLMLIATLALAGCKSSPADTSDSSMAEGTAMTAPAEPINIIESMSADQSDLPHGGIWLIRSQKELDACGSETLKALKPNLSRRDLVVVGLGPQQSAGYWVRINAIQKVGNTLFVQGCANAPAADSPTAMVETSPYCAVLIPKTGAGMACNDITAVTGKNPPADQ